MKDFVQLRCCYGVTSALVTHEFKIWSLPEAVDLVSCPEKAVRYPLSIFFNSSPICWGSVITLSLIFIVMLFLVRQWFFLLLFIVFQMVLFLLAEFIILFVVCRDFPP